MSGSIPAPGRVEAWLRERLPAFAAARVTRVTALDGGASNITCRVDLAGAPSLVVRVQRERGIFEPYDVLREGEVLRRLAKSSVPVPAVIASEADPAWLGAPFIVLEYVNAPHMGVAGPEASFAAFVAAVANIHAQDWRALDLGFLGVPASARDAVRGEVTAVAARMPSFGIGDDARLVAARDLLLAAAPDDGELALCQGDINVFNYLFRAGEVVCVVDWEQARIGDPRSDIGQLVALGHLKGAPFGPAGAQPFVLAYQQAAGRELRNMAYFRAFWLWQLAIIHHGWVAFSGSQPWYTLDHVTELLGLALAELG
ncbi:MAG: phosphotransferase family protein [Dehalococcoidia bacterium]|nr:phosphotransferase family protein [Dehalococcoidia bacterium]